MSPRLSYASVAKNNTSTTKDSSMNATSLNQNFMEEMKQLVSNLSTQILNLQKELALQAHRIDAIFQSVME